MVPIFILNIQKTVENLSISIKINRESIYKTIQIKNDKNNNNKFLKLDNNNKNNLIYYNLENKARLNLKKKRYFRKKQSN